MNDNIKIKNVSNENTDIFENDNNKEMVPAVYRPTSLLIYLVCFVIMLYLSIRVDYLRNFLIQDLLPIKELEALERKTQELQKVQSKYMALRRVEYKMVDIELLLKLNKTTQNSLKYTRVKLRNISSPETICAPEQNIAFIKTHKTGSSTVTNILNRYADLSELLVAIPSMGDVRFSWPRKFHWSSVDMMRLDGQLANILTNHARYNRKEMSKIMEDNTKYITILRNPIAQFESSFYYFEFDRMLRLNRLQNNTNGIEEFLKAPDQILYNITLLLGDLPDTLNLIKNGMFYDLGYDFIDLESDDVIDDTLRKLDKEFHIVLLMEYFDEGLVLLKNEFCWNFDDLLYIKQNQRHKRHVNLTLETQERIRTWNYADFKLYNYFNKTFWKKVEKYGDQFWVDLKEFRERNKNFEKICSPKELIQKGFGINVDINMFVMDPKVNRQHRYLCEKLLMNEVDYLKYFRQKFRISFGYQKLLIAEGIKPLNKNRRLHERLKNTAGQKAPKFLPLKGFDKKKKK